MSVQRWDIHGAVDQVNRGYVGYWMKYDDHERAVAAARAAAIRECVAAVEALSDGGLIDGEPIIGKPAALAALRALLPEADA